MADNYSNPEMLDEQIPNPVDAEIVEVADAEPYPPVNVPDQGHAPSRRDLWFVLAIIIVLLAVVIVQRGL